MENNIGYCLHYDVDIKADILGICNIEHMFSINIVSDNNYFTQEKKKLKSFSAFISHLDSIKNAFFINLSHTKI